MICYTETRHHWESPRITDCDYGWLTVTTDDDDEIIRCDWEELDGVVFISNLSLGNNDLRREVVNYLQQVLDNFKQDFPDKTLQIIISTSFYVEGEVERMIEICVEAGFVVIKNDDDDDDDHIYLEAN